MIDIATLTPNERLELIEQLWDSLDPRLVGPSAADADVLRTRRAELARDGDLGEPWRQTIQELKTRGA